MLIHAQACTECERRNPKRVEGKADLQKMMRNISSKLYSRSMKLQRNSFLHRHWIPMTLDLVGQVHIPRIHRTLYAFR